MEREGHVSPIRPLYPLILRRFIIAFSILHDMLIMIVAVYAYRAAPPTISVTLGVMQYAWVGMLLVGGLAGIVGAVRQWIPAEITGCVLMASGKVTWSISLVTVYHWQPGVIALAAFLCAGAFSTLWRATGAMIGLFLRVRD